MANLIGNPGFETDTTGWSAAGGGTITRVTDVFHSGVASALRDVTALNNSADFTNTAISASTRYLLEGYIRPTGDGTFGPGSNDGNPGFLQNKQASYSGLLTGNWYRVLLLWASHASATHTQPHFATRSGSGVDFHLDDAFLDTANSYLGAYPLDVLTDTVALYWRLGGTDFSNLCVDYSFNQRTARRGGVGTDTNFVRRDPIVYGTDDYVDNSAWEFDSPTTASWLELPVSTPVQFGGTTNYSVELWFTPTTVDTTTRRLQAWSNDETAGSNAYSITYDSTDGIKAIRRVAGASDVVSWLPTSWDGPFHVVLVYDGTDLHLWVNGVHRGQTASGTMTAPNGIFRIGQGQTQASGAKAIIDEVAVYSEALSGTRIESHFAAGSFPVTGLTFKRIYGPAQLPDSATTLYTAPTGMRTVIRHIHAINPTGTARDISLSIGTDAAATRIYDGKPIAAGGLEELRRGAEYTLEAGEVLQGFASAASSIVLVVDGYEEPA